MLWCFAQKKKKKKKKSEEAYAICINLLKCDADFKNTINQNLIIISNLMIILKVT
jgi:hypothetical protein